MNAKMIARRLWRLSVVLAVSLSAFVVVLTFMSGMRPSNCGGNSAALSHVGSISLFAILASRERPDQSFMFTKLTETEQHDLADQVRSDWIRSARFLVTSRELEFPPLERYPVVVCDTPYRNVPERTFGLAPPTHAVAYSDGITGLISPEEYAALVQNDFIDLIAIVGPKEPEGEGQTRSESEAGSTSTR